MTALRLPAPAKLNLFLQITGQGSNGYHELQTLFQLLDLADELEFQPNSSGQVQLLNPLEGVALEDNLVWRAAQLLLPLRSDQHQGVDIRLDKRLPMGGGLGAGSSDAATTLLALNHLWQLNLSLDQLAQLGLQLGADVPVFVRGRNAWAEGVGEHLSPLELPLQDYLLVHPGCHCNTGSFFRHPQLERKSPKISAAQALERLGENAFTPLALSLYPSLVATFDWFKTQGLVPWLTGTGACVFARLSNPTQGQTLLQQLPDHLQGHPLQGWVVRSQIYSPTHLALDLI